MNTLIRSPAYVACSLCERMHALAQESKVTFRHTLLRPLAELVWREIEVLQASVQGLHSASCGSYGETVIALLALRTALRTCNPSGDSQVGAVADTQRQKVSISSSGAGGA